MPFAIYDTETNVPDTVKKDYKKVVLNGKDVWIPDLDASALTAVAGAEVQTQHAGLVSNRDAIKREKEQEETARRAAQALLDKAERQVLELTNKLSNGHVVTSDDIELLSEVKKHGDKAAVVKILTEYPDISKKLTTYEKTESRRKLAQAAGITDEEALSNLLDNPVMTGEGFEVVYKQETPEGEDEAVSVPYAKFKDAEGKEQEQKFTEFINKDTRWKKFVPVLTATAEKEDSDLFELVEQKSTVGRKSNISDDPVEARKRQNEEARKNAANPLLGIPAKAAPVGGANGGGK